MEKFMEAVGRFIIGLIVGAILSAVLCFSWSYTHEFLEKGKVEGMAFGGTIILGVLGGLAGAIVGGIAAALLPRNITVFITGGIITALLAAFAYIKTIEHQNMTGQHESWRTVILGIIWFSGHALIFTAVAIINIWLIQIGKRLIHSIGKNEKLP
jgi:MFS family permease